MGNCGGCNRSNAPEQPVVTKQDRIQNFEKKLPFKSLFIDEFESLVLAVAKVSKVNNEYVPPLSKSPCQLRRIVKYFKAVDEFQELQDPNSKLNALLKSSFLSSLTYAGDEQESESDLCNSLNSTPSNLDASMNTNNTLFESIKIEIDT